MAITKFTPLVFLLACSTKAFLARQVQFLKAENQILRKRLPRCITVTPEERRLLIRLGKPLGILIKGLITIVTFQSWYRWLREGDRKRAFRWRNGRPRTPQDIERIVLKLAKENAWGYTRILGELKKLGITCIKRTTVANILKRNGYSPDSRRGEGSWDDFLKRHAKTLWACDYLHKRTWTWKGIRDVYVLLFLHVGTRRLYAANRTFNPTCAWTLEQTQAILQQVDQDGLTMDRLLCDNSRSFSDLFELGLAQRGVAVQHVAPLSPNQNALIERAVQTVQQECLDHFMAIGGPEHVNYLMKEYLEHYNRERPHQTMNNASPAPPDGEPLTSGKIRCRQRLGSVLKHYYRTAA